MLDGLTLDQMRAFIAIADAGSFRAAAGRLARAQSALSHAIGNLESQLGVRLFDRAGHRPQLTPEGRALLADMRAILQKVDCMRARARGLGEGIELSLSVAIDPLFPTPTAAAALADVNADFPDVSVHTLTAPLGEALAALRDKRAVLAITSSRIGDPHFELEAIGSISMIAVTSASHALAGHGSAAPLVAASMVDHLQIVVSDPSPLTQGRDFGVLSPGTWRVSDIATKHALILAGVGWGNLPAWLVQEDLEAGRLVRLELAQLGPGGETLLPVFLARRGDRPFGPCARRLRDALYERMGVHARPAGPDASLTATPFAVEALVGTTLARKAAAGSESVTMTPST
jgi:DNA-binding transcriptional LysR family regulator